MTMTMLALLKKPGEVAVRFDLPADDSAQLRAMQGAVGGYIETAIRAERFVVWCNEEGRLINLPANFLRPTDGEVIVGSVLITGPLVATRDGYVPSALEEADLPKIGALLAAWERGFPIGDVQLRDDQILRSVDGEIKIDRVGTVIAKGKV